MTPLEGLDPDDPDQLPEIIIGSYIAVQRGMRKTAEFAKELVQEGMPEYQAKALETSGMMRAGDNYKK
jgi:hypothetical protein